MEEIIKIEHVSKEYRLGAIGGGTLRGDLQSFVARVRGKEDPNVKIGQDVYAKNQRFLALDDVSFSVKKGERVGIIGHNGAGKSTLLKLLSRVTAPTDGTISYNGRIASMLEVGTGFHPELTGRENVYLNGAILGMSKAEITEKFDDIVRFAEMEKFIDTPVKRYSSGMYVKLAFAVAAHLDSDILVMDEVLAVGDMKFQQKCLGKMDDVSKNEGRTVLYVSHNMNTIRQLCTRCIVLDHGKVVFDGDVEEGIEVYAGKKQVSSNTVNCSVISRKKFQIDEAVFIEQVENLEGEHPVFKYGGRITLRLKFSSKRDMERCCLRIPIFSRDGSAIGMATTMPEIRCNKNEDNFITVGLDLPYLAPGLYTMRFVLYSINQFGATQTHDVVDEAFVFEIEDNSNIVGMEWNQEYWGAICFPTVNLL